MHIHSSLFNFELQRVRNIVINICHTLPHIRYTNFLFFVCLVCVYFAWKYVSAVLVCVAHNARICCQILWNYCYTEMWTISCTLWAKHRCSKIAATAPKPFLQFLNFLRQMYFLLISDLFQKQLWRLSEQSCTRLMVSISS